MAANPQAIAWYLKRSEILLDDLGERLQFLYTRSGQLAGFAGAVLALAAANAESMLAALHGAARVCAGAALLAGALSLVAAFMAGLQGARLRRSVSDLSAQEVANYVTDRFVEEPDLWRVHLRTIRGLLRSINLTTRLGDQAARSVGRAERFLFAGLSLVGVALTILVTVEAF